VGGLEHRVPRPLKVFKTHIGFYDLVVAAPSMKAAAEAWGAKPHIFSQGFAAQTQEVDAVEAALAQPGTVLKRPHGKGGAYKVEPDAIAVPKATVVQKRAAKDAAAEARRREVSQKRAARAQERKAKKDAEEELARIEREEAGLRERRQKLQKKFHLRTVK
jgi:colicin import membrane protein